MLSFGVIHNGIWAGLRPEAGAAAAPGAAVRSGRPSDVEVDLLVLVQFLEVAAAVAGRKRPLDLVFAALLALRPPLLFAASLRVGHTHVNV